MSEKQEDNFTIFQDGNMWKGMAFMNGKYYFNDIGRENFYDAIMELSDMGNNA